MAAGYDLVKKERRTSEMLLTETITVIVTNNAIRLH
jgi:hypothetical protein